MRPAIQLAKNGYVISKYEAKQFQSYEKLFRTHPNVAAIFLKNNRALKAGDRPIYKLIWPIP